MIAIAQAVELFGTERDAALETGMADGIAIGYDRLEEILASAASRK